MGYDSPACWRVKVGMMFLFLPAPALKGGALWAVLVNCHEFLIKRKGKRLETYGS